MDILLFVDFDQHAGNVGTMVGNAFDVGEQILIDVAQFHGAFFVLQPLDVAVFQFQIQGVDHFFQRLYLVCNGEVVLFERLICHVQCFQQSITQGTQFLCGIAREVQPLFVEFVC